MSIYAHSRIELSISADSRTFQLHWPLSTAPEIVLCTVDEAYILHSRNVLQSVLSIH